VSFKDTLGQRPGDKHSAVNTITPGSIKIDMYVEAARNNIPGQEIWSNEKVHEVRDKTRYFLSLPSTLNTDVPYCRLLYLGALSTVQAIRKTLPALLLSSAAKQMTF